MTGKEHVQDALEKAERALSGIRSSGKMDGEPVLEELAKACADLGQIKTRATLKTRTGVSLALPVFEAAQNLDEAWLQAQAGGEDLDDLKVSMDEFALAAEVLTGALKERTVVMT